MNLVTAALMLIAVKRKHVNQCDKSVNKTIAKFFFVFYGTT